MSAMKSPTGLDISLDDLQTFLTPWTNPGWCATTPQAEKTRLAKLGARRVMAKYGLDDHRDEAALVDMTVWAEKLSASARAAEHEEPPRASTLPVKREVEQRSARLARLGAVLFVLAVVGGVALAALR
ncbi:hypothetical protein ACSRUE_18060 [Sorangium sp. KYC3313]|uniref:hypothetical protein n=1 Tax=Sorangium sp. KYC3313 TaxID=3449740 RepID=UPI003F8C9577